MDNLKHMVCWNISIEGEVHIKINSNMIDYHSKLSKHLKDFNIWFLDMNSNNEFELEFKDLIIKLTKENLPDITILTEYAYMK